MIGRRFGYFAVSIALLEGINAEVLKHDLFANVIIWKAEYNPHNECIVYLGESMKFEKLGPGEAIPYYELNFKDGDLIEAKRREETINE